MNTKHSLTRRLLACAAFLGAQLALAALANDVDAQRGQLSASDYKFAQEAAYGGLTEVNLGRLAGERSTNAAVQQFGRCMVTDHGKANEELKKIASRLGAVLPTEPSADQQTKIDKISKLSGSEFDHAYIALMIKAHQADEKVFERASKKVENPDLKAFATSTVFLVQNHLRMAQELKRGGKPEVSMNK